MNERRAHALRLGYGIFLSVFTAVLGILLIVGAAEIYYADPNGQPYSYDLVGEKLMRLLVPALLWLVAVIGGWILSVLFPDTKKRRKAGAEFLLKKIRPRVPLGEGEEYERERAKLRREEHLRFGVWTVAALFAVAAGVMCILRLADVSGFPASNVNAEMISMLQTLLPWVGASFALFLLAGLFETISAKRSLNTVKKLLVLGKGTYENGGGEVVWDERSAHIVKWAVWAALMVVAIAFLIVGIVNGGMGDVLTKAIKICTECIGLG